MERVAIFAFLRLKIAGKTANLKPILHSPPPWPAARKTRYFAWARAVAAGIAERDFVWHQGLETEGDD